MPPFWTPKNNIKLKNIFTGDVLDGEFGEFLAQKDHTIFLRPMLSSKKLFFIAGLFAAIFLIFILRIGYLQIIKGAYYYNLAENNRIRTQIIPAYRGIIYDRNGVSLVKNKSIFSLSITPKKLPSAPAEKDQLLQNVSEIIQKPKEEIESILIDYESYANEPILIQTNLSHDEMLALVKLSSEEPSIVVDEQVQREYKTTTEMDEKIKIDSLSHVLGYIGPISKDEYEKNKKNGYYIRDLIGKIGIEMVYEKTLRGVFGKKQIEIDALGQEKRIIAKEEAVSGEDLILTIDLNMQAELEKIIKNHLTQYGKKRAAAIAMNPQNGEIYALVSLPAFSNNEFANGISREAYKKLIENPNLPLVNRAISGEYPSGSVIKPVWALGALEEGIINQATTIFSAGGIKFGNWFFPDWKAGGHGPTNVFKALAESANTFFYYIGGGYGNFKGLGLDKLLKYATIMGIGKKTGIDLPNEQEGFFPTAEWKLKSTGEPWYIGDTYHLAIGQGFLLVTPLQIATITSIIANGGTVVTPHLLKETTSPNKSEQFEPGANRKIFLRPENIEIVKKGMREVVLSGSARSLNSLGVEMSGKTGTAQTTANRSPHAWFTGFFPYQNPEMVITVLVEEGGEGSRIAASIVKDFAGWYNLNTKEQKNQKTEEQ